MADHRCPTCGADIPAADRLCDACRQREQLVRWIRSSAAAVTPKREALALGTPAPAPNGSTTFQIGRSMAGSSSSAGPTAAAPAVTMTRETPRATRWYRRPRVLVPLTVAAIAALVIGFYAYRIRETFDTINSVSTAAPSISGAALGGSSDIQIDSGPALTAMAGGSFASPEPSATTEPTATATVATSTPTATETEEPTATRTQEPTATRTLEPTSTTAPTTTSAVNPIAADEGRAADGGTDVAAGAAVDESSTVEPEPTETAIPPTETATTAPTATSTAEPSPTTEPSATAEPTTPPSPTVEPTQTLSEIDRVKNGDFERGAAEWYVEQGAAVTQGEARGGSFALTIDPTGGFAAQRVFFVPETTYYVSLWARLSTDGAEDAEVGLGFMDENDNRLTDLEPAVTKVDSEEWTEITYTFTAPANASAVQVYVWKPSGRATLYVDDVSIRSVVPPEAFTTEIKESEEGSMTILVMGVDARDGEAIDIGVRPDSLMVLHLNATTGSCRLLSIPRDTRTELPGYGLTKVNHALAVGGIDYQIQVVEQMLGLGIDHYVLIDFNGFQDLVDAVGGITVNVPDAFTSSDGQYFAAGEQQMSGKQALSYARWRGGPDGDFGRIQRQQQVLRALVQRASGLNVVASINELLPAVEANLRTDLSATEMTSVAMDYRSRCTQETISMVRLEGFDATYPDPMLQMNLSYIEVDAAEIRRKVATLLEP